MRTASRRPYAIKGYTGKQLRAAYGAGTQTGKGVTRRHHRRLRLADHRRRRRAGTRSERRRAPTAAASSRRSCPANATPSTEELRRGRLVRRGDPRRRGRARASPRTPNIVYVGAASCYDDDLLDSLGKVVDNRLADIVSNSWGDIEANQTPDLAAAYDQVFQLGAVEGIGFYFSSGDNGDEVATHRDEAGRRPGQLRLGDRGRRYLAGRRQERQVPVGDRLGHREVALSADGKSWTDSPARSPPARAAAPAGPSPQPFYQRGVVPDSLAKANGATAMRAVPGHLGGRRPEHRLPGRPDADLPGRVAAVQRVPHRRHLAGRAGHRGRPGAGPAGRTAVADRLRQPGDLRPVRHAARTTTSRTTRWARVPGLAVVRVDYANGFDAPEGLHTSLRSLGKDSSLSAVAGYDDVTGVGSPRPATSNSYPTAPAADLGYPYPRAQHGCPVPLPDHRTGAGRAVSWVNIRAPAHQDIASRDDYTDSVPQLRLALNQIDSTVGDLAGNAEAVLRWTRHSAEQGAHLVAFPEMALTGYPVEDLALRRRSRTRHAPRWSTSPRSSAATGSVTGSWCSATSTEHPAGRATLGIPAGAPQNAAAFMHDGQVVAALREAPPAELRRLRRVPLLRPGRRR